MKRLLASALAGAIAMTAFAAFPSAASAHDWHRYGGPYAYYYAAPPPPPPVYYYPHYHYDPGPAIVAGVFGAFLGAVIQSQRHHKVYKKKY